MPNKRGEKAKKWQSIFKLLRKNSPLFQIIAFEFNKIFKKYKLNKKAEEKKLID